MAGQAMTEVDRRKLITLYAQIGVSFCMLLLAFIVLLSGHYPESLEKTAFTMIGLVAGYWFR